MNRRPAMKMIGTGAVGAAGGLLAAPALADVTAPRKPIKNVWVHNDGTVVIDLVDDPEIESIRIQKPNLGGSYGVWYRMASPDYYTSDPLRAGKYAVVARRGKTVKHSHVVQKVSVDV